MQCTRAHRRVSPDEHCTRGEEKVRRGAFEFLAHGPAQTLLRHCSGIRKEKKKKRQERFGNGRIDDMLRGEEGKEM